jgi:hypothetical protein
MPQLSAGSSLNLCETVIYEQVRPGDVARVARGEKHRGLRDLLGRTKPAPLRCPSTRLVDTGVYAPI